MTVEQSNTIDFVVYDPTRDEVLLVMIEHRTWADRGFLLPDLQAKLNTYLAYVSEGNLSRDFPSVSNKSVHFHLRASLPPGKREIDFLGIVLKHHLAPIGVRLSWKVIGEDVETRRLTRR
jgi:hypothetical protein